MPKSPARALRFFVQRLTAFRRRPYARQFWFRSSWHVVLCQEAHGLLATLKLVDQEEPLTSLARRDPYLHIDASAQRGDAGGPSFSFVPKVLGEQQRLLANQRFEFLRARSLGLPVTR
jgi:hypothetical protein